MKKTKSKLWGGRFRSRTSPTVERFTHSLAVDRRLARWDLLGSIAHVEMLGKTRVIQPSDARRLSTALKTMLKAEQGGRLKLDPAAEDVHTAIQWALERKVGSVAGRLHTARSRNDQVVTALRLYCKERGSELSAAIRQLQRAILHQAQKSKRLILPGYTHLRHAQPVVAAHVWLSYLEMLGRDQERLREATGRLNELPLGSGALTGTSLAIDRRFLARRLGFSRVCENSLDAVTDRDFVAELLSVFSLLSIHLARIAEDLLLWSTAEFGFIQFQEQMLTGSSMMPQKQNPDFLELVRGGTARIAGDLMALLTLLKGLSSGYQRDLQMDKEIFFGALDQVEGMLAVLTEGVGALRWNRAALDCQLQDDSLYATDLAEFLVEKGVPFAQAHRAVGQLLAHAERNQCTLKNIPLTAWKRYAPEFDGKALRLLSPETSVKRKRSAGSTGPGQIANQIRRWRKRLASGSAQQNKR